MYGMWNVLESQVRKCPSEEVTLNLRPEGKKKLALQGLSRRKANTKFLIGKGLGYFRLPEQASGAEEAEGRGRREGEDRA